MAAPPPRPCVARRPQRRPSAGRAQPPIRASLVAPKRPRLRHDDAVQFGRHVRGTPSSSPVSRGAARRRRRERRASRACDRTGRCPRPRSRSVRARVTGREQLVKRARVEEPGDRGELHRPSGLAARPSVLPISGVVVVHCARPRLVGPGHDAAVTSGGRGLRCSLPKRTSSCGPSRQACRPPVRAAPLALHRARALVRGRG